METSINALLTTLDEYELKIEAAQEQLSYLETNLPTWIDMASVILTILLFWLGLSQVGIFIIGWSFFKKQDLLANFR